MRQLFSRQLSVAKIMCFLHSNELLSSSAWSWWGCFSSEKSCHYHGDSLVWTGPQWAGPPAVAVRKNFLDFSRDLPGILEGNPRKSIMCKMDAAVWGDRLPEGTQKHFLSPVSLSLQRQNRESPKVLAGWAFCEMLLHYPHSALRIPGVAGGGGGGQQQFATQTLCVHLLGIEKRSQKQPQPSRVFWVSQKVAKKRCTRNIVVKRVTDRTKYNWGTIVLKSAPGKRGRPRRGSSSSDPICVRYP